jgi:hypothetical protein
MILLLWLLGGIVVLFGFVVFRGAPYVPSHRRDVALAFDELYELSEKDVLVDAGSGDGVILRMAAARGAKAVGYELNPALVAVSRLLSRKNEKIRIRLSDFWLTPLPYDTTVVYGFMVQRDINKMAKKLQSEANRLEHPLYFISYGSEIPARPKIKASGAHNLYRFDPLHAAKA